MTRKPPKQKYDPLKNVAWLKVTSSNGAVDIKGYWHPDLALSAYEHLVGQAGIKDVERCDGEGRVLGK